MSGESLLALAVCHASQFDGAVIRPSDELPGIHRLELEVGDAIAVALAPNSCVKARRVPSARSMVVPQDQIHDVGLAVEQPV
jgi:uncharacterized membrane protein